MFSPEGDGKSALRKKLGMGFNESRYVYAHVLARGRSVGIFEESNEKEAHEASSAQLGSRFRGGHSWKTCFSVDVAAWKGPFDSG